MSKLLKMKMPTSQQHEFVLQLVDEAIRYHRHMSIYRGKAKALMAWRDKYSVAYTTATER